MKYICLVYHDERELRELPEPQLDEMIVACGEWVGEMQGANHHVYSAALQAPQMAATLKKRDGKIFITDGPFTETKEFLAGFTILEARDLNEAIQIVSKSPALSMARMEVRPLLLSDSDPSDPMDVKITAALRRCFHE